MNDTKLPEYVHGQLVSAHKGYHTCVDGRHYTASCLVTDPTCWYIVASIMAKAAKR
jgi:hypothetical protein